LSVAGYLLLAAGWLIWFLPFPLTGWDSKTPERKDNRARWGLALECLAYALLCLGEFWTRPPTAWRMVGAVVFLSLASVLSWTATRALGRHLRFDAALTAGHQLVRTGPYRIVRHPIYTSMFCLLLGTGFVIASVPLVLAVTVIFICGTEIRVRIEDGLLASRFGAVFKQYQRTVSAYVPLIR
jgi:protein-S-isoprenylcysteine O-methyltransferase Ste14